MTNQQESSDGLPFTQVDRAVKAKAALLAGRLGVSPQHALGSLVHFWDLNGDPRELEALWAEGKDEIVLTDSEVRIRFAIASGKDVDPAELALLGLLEPRGILFRVRGMSRFFAPIKRRIQAREAASKGGLKTAAKARRSVDGRFGSRLDVAQAPALAESKRQPSGHPSDDQAEVQAPAKSEDRGQRTEDIFKEEEALPLPPVVVRELVRVARANPPPPRNPSDKFVDGPAFWAWAQWKRHEVGHVQERPPHPSKLSAWWSEALMELNGEAERLEPAFYRFAEDPHWDTRSPSMPFAGFMAVWRNFVPRKTV